MKLLWIVAALFLLIAPANAGFSSCNHFGGSSDGFAGSANCGGGAPPAYVGPGDINGAAWSWVGLRAYSATYAASHGNAVDLVDQAGANPITITVLLNGSLDVATISAWVTAHSVTTIRVAKLYDQTENGRFWSQATLADMPVLTLNGLGSKPTMDFDGSASTLSLSTGLGTNGTGSISTVFKVLSGGSNFQGIYTNNNGPQIVAHESGTPNQVTLAANSNINVIAADDSFHAAQTTQTNGGILSFYVDGGSNTLPTAGNFFGDSAATLSGGSGMQLLRGSIQEFGLYLTDQSATNAAMNSNQHSYWGF